MSATFGEVLAVPVGGSPEGMKPTGWAGLGIAAIGAYYWYSAKDVQAGRIGTIGGLALWWMSRKGWV